MSLIFLATGRATMGINKRDKDGNIIEKVPARFEFENGGPCVAVGELDPETMQVKGDVDLFGDWQAAEYLEEAMKKLKPRRPVNIPDFKALIQEAYTAAGEHTVCFMCPAINCRECIVNEWLEEVK